MAVHSLAWLAIAGLLALAGGSWTAEEEEDHRSSSSAHGDGHAGYRLGGERGRLDISPLEVEQFQDKWANRIVGLGRLLETESVEHARREAEEIVDALYGHDFSNVVVKPTGVHHKPYRNTARGVISWLIGHDDQFPQDEGFAAEGWRRIEHNNVGISKVGDQALAMGHAHFIGQSGRVELVTEYSMGFIRDQDNKVTLNMHFSSVPFDNNTNSLRSDRITEDEVKRAQRMFVRDIVHLGTVHRLGLSEEVERFVEDYFAFGHGSVLFKPPGVVGERAFRSKQLGIYSYFGGSNEDYGNKYPDDEGFVRLGWIHGSFENAGIVLDRDEARAVGTYTFLGRRRSFEAHYSITYVRERGTLRISLFAASTPSEATTSRHRNREDCFGGSEINIREIEEAQKAWADGIVDIGSTYAIKGDYRRRAEEFVDRMYAYQSVPVLYKPADALQFRTSRAGAVSYFVGGNKAFPQDEGFALKGWEHVHFTNVDAILTGEEIVTMGYVSYASSSGVWRTAQMAMGFIPDESGALRINLQHASFPERSKHWSPSRNEEEPRRDEDSQITRRAIDSAQERWGEWLVRIGQARDWVRARQLAGQMVDELYDFAGGQVLLKVIEATNATRFRFTRRGLLSFLVGRDCIFPADRGFALDQPWTKVRFENKDYASFDRTRANTFGTASFCCYSDGSELEINFVSSYVVESDGSVRLFLHDMALPFEEEAGSWAEAALGSVGSSLTSFTHIGGGGEESEGVSSGAILAILGAAAVIGLFAFFACCWSGMAKGARGGGGRGQVDYGYGDDYGYGGDSGYLLGAGQGLDNGNAGMYSRAGPSAAYGMSYQYDHVQGQNQSYAVRGGAHGNFSQSRLSMSQPARGGWRTAGSVPQRLYS